MKKKFKIIGFDADDTLWVNEPYYLESEVAFCNLLSDYLPADKVSEELFRREMKNLEMYGYGAKSFILSMIETALEISSNRVDPAIIASIISLGKAQINKPVILLDGVLDLLESLSGNGQKLIVATKGDLLDQERKLEKSGIARFFHHIEIMSDKKGEDYKKLLEHLDIEPSDFLMIGNSLKSDILPVIELGGYGVYVPYHTTWEHEKSIMPDNLVNFEEIRNISEIKTLLGI